MMHRNIMTTNFFSSGISKLQECIQISKMLNDTSDRRENVEKDSLDENRFVIYFNYVLVYGCPFLMSVHENGRYNKIQRFYE